MLTTSHWSHWSFKLNQCNTSPQWQNKILCMFSITTKIIITSVWHNIHPPFFNHNNIHSNIIVSHSSRAPDPAAFHTAPTNYPSIQAHAHQNTLKWTQQVKTICLLWSKCCLLIAVIQLKPPHTGTVEVDAPNMSSCNKLLHPRENHLAAADI